ncbi:MAG: ATP-binding protein, partial [Dehalococcoidia bacterium]
MVSRQPQPDPARTLRLLPGRLRILPAPPTPLVGRQQELATATAWLHEAGVRLVTITGPPGVGKTRLALDVGSRLADEFADGLAFIRLDTVYDPEQVLPAIGRALGLSEAAGQPAIDMLSGYLQEKRLLLVLDNLEQVLPAAVDLAGLLAACPAVSILATSRAALQIRGEHELQLSSLALPSVGGDRDAARSGVAGAGRLEAAAAPAVQLFVQRAQAVRPGFALDDDNAGTVAAICARLDGLPLAIELAAARSSMFAPKALLARLVGARGRASLQFLTAGARDLPARQQTLRNAIDWSHELLSPDERTLLRRLSAFVGGCTLAAAQAVCGPLDDGDTAVLDALTSLFRHSLLTRGEEPDGEPRFDMLATIREYAEAQLEASGEMDAIHQRHFDYMLAVAMKGAEGLQGPDQGLWVHRHEREHDNVRAALERALANGDAAGALQLATSLGEFWGMRASFAEAAGWLERGLQAPGHVPAALRAEALNQAGMALGYSGQGGRGVALLEEAVALSREIDDTSVLAKCLNNLGNALWRQGDLERAADLLEQSVVLRRGMGDNNGASRTLGNLAAVQALLGKYEQAIRSYEELIQSFRASGNQNQVAMALTNLGTTLRLAGEHDRAGPLLEESLAIFRGIGNQRGIVVTLTSLTNTAIEQVDAGRALVYLREALSLAREATAHEDTINGLESRAGIALLEGDHALAATLLAAIEAACKTTGVVQPPDRRSEHERRLTLLRSTLDAAAFARAG